MDKKMTEMKNLEIAKFLESECGSYESAKLFFEELGIEIIIAYDVEDDRQGVYTHSYNNKNFCCYHENEFQENGLLISFIQSLLNILEPENLEKVKQEAIGMQSRQSSKKGKTSSKKESSTTININNNNTATANAINENIISISTLSQLTTEVSQNTTLTNEVKTEIQNIISDLEDAEKKDDEDSYF